MKILENNRDEAFQQLSETNFNIREAHNLMIISAVFYRAIEKGCKILNFLRFQELTSGKIYTCQEKTIFRAR